MNSILFKTSYKNSTATRQYEIEDVADEAIQTETVRNKVMAINESLAGGSATALASLFVADDYDSTQDKGTLARINNVKIKTVTETEIEQTPETRTYSEEENPEIQPEPDIPDDMR